MYNWKSGTVRPAAARARRRCHGWCLQRLFGRVAAVLLALSGSPIQAHHSYAMFNKASVTDLRGTVAKFEWTNPHVFLWVYAASSGGDSPSYQLYGFEGGSPGTLLRSGWSPDTFVVGEKVTVRFYPLKDGRNGGSFFRVTHADGSVSSSEGAGGPPP